MFEERGNAKEQRAGLPGSGENISDEMKEATTPVIITDGVTHFVSDEILDIETLKALEESGFKIYKFNEKWRTLSYE